MLSLPMDQMKSFRREVRLYHSLPSIAAFLIVPLFITAWYFAKTPVFPTLITSAAAVVLLWRWAIAGRRVDLWRCSNCGKSAKGMLVWSYPPANCPYCAKPKELP